MSMSDLQRLGQEFDQRTYKGWSIDFADALTCAAFVVAQCLLCQIEVLDQEAV